jgi:carbamoyltransferase
VTVSHRRPRAGRLGAEASKVKPGTAAAALGALRERLRGAGFTADALRRLLGITFPDDIGLLNRAPTLERLRADRTPPAALVRLFFLEDALTAGVLRGLLPAGEQETLWRIGLLARRGRRVVARLRLDVVGDAYVLSDRRFRPLDRHALALPRGDMVYPPGSDSALLAQITPPRPGATVLDLCTGSGVQGLAAAAWAARVGAVDTNPRAVALARWNAALNARENFQAHIGDLFAAVRGQRFDVIIANPPFVPSPRRGPSYHSGGPHGDRVLKRIVRGLFDHLGPGGRAFVISHLGLRAGDDVGAILRGWLGDADGRVLGLLVDSGSPVDLAAAQALFALDRGFRSYAREVRTWVAYLRRHRIERIILLLLVAERDSRPLRVEMVEAYQRTLPLPLTRPPHEHVADWLVRGGGEA